MTAWEVTTTTTDVVTCHKVSTSLGRLLRKGCSVFLSSGKELSLSNIFANMIKAITKTRLCDKRDFHVFHVFSRLYEKSLFFGKIALFA